MPPRQAVVDIWLRLPQLREPGRIEAWSYRILVNACYLVARRQKRWVPGLARDASDEPDRTDAISGVVLRDQLERGFRRLPVDQRAVIVLHHYLDLPFGEVAEVLGIAPGTVYSRHHRAMRALRAVHDWLDATAVEPPRAVLADALARVATLPQPRPRWLGPWHRTDTARRKNRLMSIATAVATTVVALALAATLFVPGDTPPQGGGAAADDAPAAPVGASADPSAPALVSGTSAEPGSVESMGTATNVDGIDERHGVVQRGAWDFDDPRLDGKVTYTGNWHSVPYMVGSSPFVMRIESAIYEVTNPGGGWTGAATACCGVGPAEPTTAILSGTGGYEGLTAYLVLDYSKQPPLFQGVIFPGPMPPVRSPAPSE